MLGSGGVGPDHRGQPAGRLRRRPGGGLFYHPVVVDGVRADDELFHEETFGPLVGVTTYATLDEAIELANAPGYGLSVVDLHHRPARRRSRFRRRIGAGMV